MLLIFFAIVFSNLALLCITLSFSPRYLLLLLLYIILPRLGRCNTAPICLFHFVCASDIFQQNFPTENFPSKFSTKKHKRIFHQTFPTENLPSTRSKYFLRNTCFTQVAGWSGGRVSAKAKGFPVELEDVWNQCGNRIVNSGDLWKQLERVHRPTLLSQVSRAN